jgi:glycosyltransferase involved in cell wall biosynthesis
VQALLEAKEVWALSRRAQRFLHRRRADIEIVEPAVQSPPATRCGNAKTAFARGEQVTFAVIGSYEPRKGQDLAIDSIKLLPAEIRQRCRFNFFGRILDKHFYSAITERAEHTPQIRLGPELSHDDCLEAMRDADIILCPSRDDSFSLVAMEALAMGKILLCTRTTGASDYIRHRRSGFVIPENTPRSIGAGIIRCLRMESAWPEIARGGREVFLGHFSFEAFSERIRQRLSA